MSYKRLFTALLALIFSIGLLTGIALAAESPSPEEAALSAAALEEEAAAKPPVSPFAGGMGLVALLIFGTLTSQKHRVQEEAGCDPMIEEHRIENPYSRLAGRGTHRRYF